MFDAKKYQQEWYQKNKKQHLARQKERNRLDPTYRIRARKAAKKFRASHPELREQWNKQQRDYQKQYRVRLREQILINYGAICACCGETETKFLTPDHIHGGGTAHWRKRKTVGIYIDIIREGFPRNKYQILCMNCNWAKSVYGVCPHACGNKR